MTIAPSVKGWCPGAYRPMMSGDGLVVRVRPRLARLDRDQVLGLCAVAQEFGNGVLDLTNRANLQIRGVREEDHEAVLEALNALGLLDADPAFEGRRNILMTPFWRAGNVSQDLASELMSRLGELPELPAKFGFAIDTAPVPLLRNDPADIRLERLADGQIILLADGAGTGRVVDQDAAIDAVIELARWFAASTRTGVRRMHRLLDLIDLPSAYLGTAPAPVAAHPDPGPLADGYFLGAPFGQMDAAALTQLMTDTGATADFGTRTQPCERPDLGAGTDYRTLQMAKITDFGVGFDRNAGGEYHIPADFDARRQNRVVREPDRIRVQQRDTRIKRFSAPYLLILTFRRRQVRLAVHTEEFGFRCHDCRTGPAVLTGDGHQIRQIVLALGVVVVHPVEPR